MRKRRQKIGLFGRIIGVKSPSGRIRSRAVFSKKSGMIIFK